MAWGWSHTQEAYAAAYENVRRLPSEDLRVIMAEWQAGLVGTGEWGEPEFSLAKYRRAIKRLERENLPDDVLADAIWDRASDLATCDNGGWNAWICPYGCHTVPFSLPDEA